MSRKAKRRGSGSATTIIGGAMAGFEEQVFKSLPRIEELVRRGQDVRGLAADGSGLSVGFPPDEAPGEAAEISTPEPPTRPAPPEPNKAAKLRPGRRQADLQGSTGASATPGSETSCVIHRMRRSSSDPDPAERRPTDDGLEIWPSAAGPLTPGARRAELNGPLNAPRLYFTVLWFLAS